MLSEIQRKELEKIIIQPSNDISIDRFSHQDDLEHNANCSGKCKSPGGCTFVS